MQTPQSIEEIKAGLETTEKGGVRQSIRNCLTVFPVSYTHLSSMTVKRSLNELENAGLIMRVRQGVGEPNRIYVLIRCV